MATVGSVFLAGRAAGSAWVEYAPAAGTFHAGFSEQGSASAFAGGLPVLLTPRSNAGSQLELEVARRGVEQIAEGSYHGAGVADDGTVYAWGVNELGQLGQGVGPKTLASSATPMLVRSLRDVVSVACGDSHTVAVRYDGAVYSWGSSSSGQLGHGSTHPSTPAAPEFVPSPRCMSSLHRLRITSAAAGSQFTLLVAASGELFSCGEGASGQLGLGRVTKVDVPTRVALVGGPPSRALLEGIRARGALVGEASEEEAIDTAVAAVAAGWGHSILLTRSGHVFTCGLNTHSQLGLGDSSTRHEATLVYELASSKDGDGREVFTPQPLRAARVAAGRSHSACLTPTGRALTWGSSMDGRLGHSFGEGPANLYAASVGAMAAGEHDSAIGSLGVDFAQPKPGIASEPSTEALDIDGLVTPSMMLGDSPVASSYDATPLPRGTSTWPFKSGVGPLRPPPAGQEAAGYRVPAHVLRNAAAVPVRHVPAARDPTTGRAHFPAVEAGTWSFPTVRTPSHVRGLEEGRVYAAGEADRIARQPFEPLRDAFNASVGSLEAMVAATRTPGAVAVPLGKPWLRAPLRRSDDVPCNVPTQVTHPALAGRPVVNITCGEGETLFFVPAVLSSVTPPQVLTAGGSVLTLSGPGLSSVCKVPEAALRATLATAASAEAAAAAVAAYTPVPDESGLVPIPGVFVRFTCSFEDLLSGTAEPEGGVRSEVRMCKAYYPRLYDFGGFSAGGGGGTALAFREDGMLGAVGGVSTSGPTDMDVMLTISPSVTRPCVATVQVVVPSSEEAEDAAFTAEGATVVHGAQRLECISEPYLTGCTPSSVAVGAGPGPVVAIAGEWLFGTALVDSVARPVAEDLTRAVMEALRAREAAEEAGIARELAAIAGQQVDAPPAAEPAGLLDFSLTAGSQEAPCDILVCFDIIVNGAPAGRTDPVRAWYTLKYEEKKLDVVAARAALIAGMQGKGGSRGASRGSPGSRSGVVPPSPTPWLAVDAADEDGGASPSLSKVAEEEPTIVGVYAATILVELPEVGGLVAGKAGTPVPAAVSAVLAILASAELDGTPAQHVDEAALTAARAYVHGDTVVAATAAAAGASPAVQLKPRISFNAGYDWSSGTACVQAMRPAASFSTPALTHLGRTTDGVIWGTGLPVGAVALVRVSPLGGGESLTVKGRFIDGNRVGYTLPSLLPLVGGPEVIGFASFLLTLFLDGGEVAGPPGGMLLTAYAGAGGQGGCALVALGGNVALTLAPCSIPRVDALAVRSAGRGHESDALPGLSWIPPTARIGCVHTGVADNLRVAVQTAGGKPVDVAFTHDASAGTLEVTLPEGTPSGPFSVLIAVEGDMASAVVMGGAGCVFDPASLSITGLGPKKLAPGAELLLTMGGLGAVMALAEGPRATPPAPTVRLTVAGALGPVYTGVMPATLLPEAAGVTTTLPGTDVAPALAGADAEACVSLDGGKSWTPPFAIKVAKK